MGLVKQALRTIWTIHTVTKLRPPLQSSRVSKGRSARFGDSAMLDAKSVLGENQGATHELSEPCLLVHQCSLNIA